MEQRIEIELRGKKPYEVAELLLDNCIVSKISGLTEEFFNLTTISLINCGLTTLEGIPHLESLRTIDLSDNRLVDGLEILVEKCPRLYHINLCANKIKEIESLKPLKKLKELSALDLFDCDVTEIGDYRQKVFELLPQLKYLDGFDVNDIEAEISEDEELEDGIEEDGEFSYEEYDEETNETNGLSYLNSSKALQDEDESEDFVESVNNQNVKKTSNGETARGVKRKHDVSGTTEENNQDDEPKTKS